MGNAMSGPGPDSMPDVIRRYFAAVNTDRFDDLREVFAADVVIHMAGASERSGMEAALAYYPRALAPLPVHSDEPVGVVVSDDGHHVTVDIAFAGETADGRPVVFSAVDWFELDDAGRVVRLRSFYDTAHVVASLHGSGRAQSRTEV